MKRKDSGEEDDIYGINDANIKKICADVVSAEEHMEETQNAMYNAIKVRDDALKELLKAVAAKEQALEADRKAFELSTKRVDESVLPERIKLDVSGRIFSVTHDMMQRFPLSYFGSLFSGRWKEKMTPDGAFFINRSSRLFDHIVDFLRDGELSVTLSEEDRDALYKEADYYQLKDYMVPVKQTTKWTWLGGLKTTPSIMHEYSFGTIGWNKGVHEWTLRLTMNEKSYAHIGIASAHVVAKSAHGDANTYKFDCGDGYVWNPTEDKWTNYSKRPDKGSNVSVRLDMDKRELSFLVNGTWGPVIRGIAGITWYPCVGLRENERIEIVE